MSIEHRKDTAGHVIEILEEEFEDFTTEAQAFLAGKREEDQFIGFRLKQGVYGQRQANVQMIRVKLPFGGRSHGRLFGCWVRRGSHREKHAATQFVM